MYSSSKSIERLHLVHKQHINGSKEKHHILTFTKSPPWIMKSFITLWVANQERSSSRYGTKVQQRKSRILTRCPACLLGDLALMAHFHQRMRVGSVRLGGVVKVRCGSAQLSYGSHFHHRQYPYGRAGFKPNSDSRSSYVSIVIS